jgi:hypothetical protein
MAEKLDPETPSHDPMVPEPPTPPSPARGRRYYVALASYGAIALLAGFTLDGKLRLGVWLFLAYIAFRTYLHTLQKP